MKLYSRSAAIPGWLITTATSITVVLVSLQLGGCDKLSDFAPAAFKSKTFSEFLADANRLIDQKKFGEARSTAEGYLTSKEDASGQLALIIARSAAQTNDIPAAVKYLGIALASGAITGEQAMVDPQMEPARTDIRFVALIAHAGATRSGTPQAAAPEAPKKSGDAIDIQLDSSGVSVKNGDISIRLAK